MKKKLSVLFICGWYPSKVLPTNGDFIQRHAEAVSLKHNVTAIHIITDKSLKKNIEITSKQINGINTEVAYIKFTKNSLKKLFLYIQAFKTLINKSDTFDIVHLNELFPFGIFSIYLKWFKNIPFIVSEHWTGYFENQSKEIGFFRKLITKIISKNASFICPVSISLKNEMQKFGLIGKYKIVPNVIDTSRFVFSTEKESTYTIIHISSLLDVHKNISGMLRVAKKLESKIPNFTWKFIGGKKSDYSSLISSLNFLTAKIEFIDHISHQKLIRHIQTSNLFVSFSNYETFGIVMIEALACGIPVISTNTGILNELKENEYYTTVPTKDENKLLTEIINRYNSNNIYNKELMHNFVDKNYSKEIIANQFSELYYSALN